MKSQQIVSFSRLDVYEFGMKVEYILELWASLGAVWKSSAFLDGPPFLRNDSQCFFPVLRQPAFNEPASNHHTRPPNTPTAMDGGDPSPFLIISENIQNSVHVIG